MTKRYRSDVAIVGGGMAGVTAALELIRAGKTVTILERAPLDRFGGSALESFGGLFFVDSPEQRRMGLTDSPEMAFADWESFAEFGPNEHWPRTWAKHIVERATPDGRDWLKAVGMSWLPVVLWVERGQSVRGNTVPRFHLSWGTGKRVVTQVIAALRAHPNAGRVTILCGHRVDNLEMTNGVVTGASGVTEDGEDFRAEADAVIVAAGGIGGDAAQVRNRWTPGVGLKVPEDFLLGTHPTADGRVVEAAARSGAGVTHVGRMWNYAGGIRHPRPMWPGHGVSLVPPKSAMWADASGTRIMPPMVSGFDTYDLVRRVCALPHGYSWQIMNRKIALKELAASGADWNPAVRERKPIRFVLDMLVGNKWLVDDLTTKCPDVVTAGSVAELAQRMNAMNNPVAVDARHLEDELRRFDATLGSDDEQRGLIETLRAYRGDRMRLVKNQRILDASGGPLIAMRERIVTRKSLGGVVTDLKSRALNAADAPIPGLYAAGESAGFGGGGSHGWRALEGTFLLSCVITARRAAQAIVQG